MRLTPFIVALFAAACTTAFPGERVRLCDALGSVQPGERLRVTIPGIVVSGSEFAVLFDPDETVCRANVQPATTIEFAPDADRGVLNQALRETGWARVVVRGVLYGPGIVVGDGTGDPVFAAHARATNRRYGHSNMFRTQLVINRVLAAEPAALSAAADWNAIPVSSAPIVQSAVVPTYPKLARAAGISGDVRLRFAIVDGAVLDVETLSGDRLLSRAAAENVKTWRFLPGTDAEIQTVFRYRLERRPAGANLNARVEMLLPESITITSASDDW